MAGLLLIISIVWFTMILCFALEYSLIPPIDQLFVGGPGRLIINIIQLAVAGLVLLIWLYAWNLLVKFYFSRNLNASDSKASKISRKRRT